MSRKKSATATGVLVIDKHEGVTSFAIISIVRRLYDMSEVGHTGTLDPMATGVLPVLLGRAVKASDLLAAEDKEYVARMTLGVTTDTEDSTGNVTSRCDDVPSDAEVYKACRAFEGDILQTPPMYSALKVSGKKLCDVARAGGEVERAPRPVTVYSIEPARISEREYELKVSCSKGTYIRTLCADIGRALGCGAVMSALRRTRCGEFRIEDSYTTDRIAAMTFEERVALPAPTESLFVKYPAVELNEFETKLIMNGEKLYQKKLGTSFADGTLVRIKHGGVFLALARVENFDAGSALKAKKLFVI
ncbi:MAG: tRNA pseudouridine(55) synthase TruB [Clostridia bacterium]|nr:tRNA pseudouridine(55) synthase TruB [Clostridia bacterium]